jgi:hypothetical protein
MATDIATEPRDPIDRAHEQAVKREPAEMAAELQELLGQKLVAFALGDRHPKTIGRYARGERRPEDNVLGRLVDLYAVVKVLEDGQATAGPWIKKWMLGSNMRLNGKAPIQLLHNDRGYQVMGAAKAFVSGL